MATLAFCLLGAVKAYQEAEDSNTYFNHPSTNGSQLFGISPNLVFEKFDYKISGWPNSANNSLF